MSEEKRGERNGENINKGRQMNEQHNTLAEGKQKRADSETGKAQ